MKNLVSHTFVLIIDIFGARLKEYVMTNRIYERIDSIKCLYYNV